MAQSMSQSLAGNLGNGQQLFLEQSGDRTVITLMQSTPGQQQSQRSSILTGTWTETPVLLQTAIGWIVELESAQGHFTIQITIQIQGNAIQLLADSTPVTGIPVSGTTVPLQPQETSASTPPMQPMSPMQPMQPMQPLKMGEMEMQMQPMMMRMGNLEMQMGNRFSEASSERVSERASEQMSESDRRAKFCSQCGQAVQPADNFCSQCGHSLHKEGR